MRTSSDQLQDLYSQIKNKSNSEIENLISRNVIDPHFYGTGSILGYPLYKVLRRALQSNKDVERGNEIKVLQEVCIDFANSNEFKNQIKMMLQNNPQSTNFFLSIIQLLAPAIAQQYSGIPAMAIVGAITLLCRQGIDNYLKD